MSDMSQLPRFPGLGGARIIPAGNPEQIELIRNLFREYADATGSCECFEGFGKEIAGLPGPYSPPAGQLLLAELDDRSAGCVALLHASPAAANITAATLIRGFGCGASGRAAALRRPDAAARRPYPKRRSRSPRLSQLSPRAISPG